MSRPSFARLPCRRSFASSSSRSAYAFPRERNPSLWKVLGVEEGASIADVKAACKLRIPSLLSRSDLTSLSLLQTTSAFEACILTSRTRRLTIIPSLQRSVLLFCALELKPDKYAVQDRFHLLQTAYETLGNADKRASYIK